MRVGVLLPAYNVEPYLGEMLGSVARQTYPALGYVVDDASTDRTAELAGARLAASHAARMGWPLTLNDCATAAIGDGCDAVFVANSDDWLREDCIERCVARLEADPGLSFCVVYAQQVGGLNTVQVSKRGAVLGDFREWPPMVNMALIRSEVWQAVGGYSTDTSLPGTFGSAEDWDFWVSLFKLGLGRYEVVEEPVYFYRMREGQLHEESRRMERHGETVQLLARKHPDLWS